MDMVRYLDFVFILGGDAVEVTRARCGKHDPVKVDDLISRLRLNNCFLEVPGHGPSKPVVEEETEFLPHEQSEVDAEAEEDEDSGDLVADILEQVDGDDDESGIDREDVAPPQGGRRSRRTKQ